MKRCSSCNMLCEDYMTVCSRCGKRLDSRQGGAVSGYQQINRNNMSAPSSNGGYAGYVIGDRFDHTREFSPEEISKGKPLAMVTYLCGLLGIGLGLLDRDSKYVQFHVRQNLKYTVVETLADLALLIMFGFTALIGMAAKSLEVVKIFPVFGAIWGLIALFILVLKFICFVWVGLGKAKEALLVRHFNFMR